MRFFNCFILARLKVFVRNCRMLINSVLDLLGTQRLGKSIVTLKVIQYELLQPARWSPWSQQILTDWIPDSKKLLHNFNDITFLNLLTFFARKCTKISRTILVVLDLQPVYKFSNQVSTLRSLGVYFWKLYTGRFRPEVQPYLPFCLQFVEW